MRFVVLFFKLLVNAWLHSSYMEDALWKTITHDCTSANESYNHSLWCWLSKNYHHSEFEYNMKEACAYLDRVAKDDQRVEGQKKLAFTKHCTGGFMKRAQKSGQDRPFVNDSLKAIFEGDSETMLGCAATQRRIVRLLEDRKKALAKACAARAAQPDQVMDNLKLNGHKQLGSPSLNGFATKHTEAESEWSARPVPPYPMKAENLLDTAMKKERLGLVMTYTLELKRLMKERIEKIPDIPESGPVTEIERDEDEYK